MNEEVLTLLNVSEMEKYLLGEDSYRKNSPDNYTYFLKHDLILAIAHLNTLERVTKNTDLAVIYSQAINNLLKSGDPRSIYISAFYLTEGDRYIVSKKGNFKAVNYEALLKLSKEMMTLHQEEIKVFLNESLSNNLVASENMYSMAM